MMNRYFCVIGSLTYRIMNTSDSFGQTNLVTITNDYRTDFGGRGGNQAATLAKLGAGVNFIGKVGDDIFGKEYLNMFENIGVTTKFIETEKGLPTGLSTVTYKSDSKDYVIMLSRGANTEVTPQYLEKQSKAFGGTSVFLLPGELSLETTYYAKKKIQSYDKVMLFAPCLHMTPPLDLLDGVDYMTPNFKHAKQITGIDIVDHKSGLEAAKFLLNKGVKHVVLKAIDGGVYYASKYEAFYCEGYKDTPVVDPAASDEAFNAALAFALSKTSHIREAIVFAQSVKSYVAHRKGAIMSLPTYKEAEDFHRSQILEITEL